MNSLSRGLSFVGVRTPAFEAMKAFYKETMRFEVRHERDQFVAFSSPDGSRLELFGPDEDRHRHFSTGPVPGFEVADIVVARRALQDAGVDFLSGVEGTPGRTRWVHFRAPDGNVYEIVHHPDLADSHAMKDEGDDE